MGIANLIDEKIRQNVYQGNTIVTGSAPCSLSIIRMFIGKTGTFAPAAHTCTVNVTPAKALREEVTIVPTSLLEGHEQVAGGDVL